MSPSFNSPGAHPASFISLSDLKPGLTLISGSRGAGKTRWCMELAEKARKAGMDLRGLISPAVMEKGEKVGYDLLDLGSGERRRLAYRIGQAQGDLATQDWQMLLDTLAWGNEILTSIKDCDIFILDEAGPLEFVKGVGLTAGLDLLDSNPGFPCFLALRPSLIEAALKRWPWAKVMELEAETGS